MNTQINEDTLDTVELSEDIVKILWKLKAKNAIAIDLRGRASYTDFIIVCSGTSSRHVQAIAKETEAEVKNDYGIIPLGSEGLQNGDWGLIDFGDVILHIFNGDARQDYDLETMWRDAPRLDFGDEKPKELYGYFELDRFPDQLH